MSEKTLFVAKLFGASIVLFALRGVVSAAYGVALALLARLTLPVFQPGVVFELTGGSFFAADVALIPFMALIIATPGMDLVKRGKVFGVGLAVVLLSDLVVMWSGLPLAGSAPFIADDSAGNTLYRTLLLIFPIVLWLVSSFRELEVLLAGGTPQRASTARTRRCPICGKRKTGLADHIRSAHGDGALRKARIESDCGS